ncbi:hypothetical protein AAC387_Pa09g0292 [Persea americana]
MNITCDEVTQGSLMRIPSTINVHPPNHANTKGSGKRIKGDKEKALEKAIKGRLCHGCKKRGVDHDKRNCPALREKLPSTMSDGFVYNESQASITCISNEEHVEEM